MKKLFNSILLMLLLIISKPSLGCHGLALMNYNVTVGATGVTIDANSDPATCGCGPYYMEVELRCTNVLTGATPGCGSAAWNTYPWYRSLLNIPGYNAASGWVDNCVLEPYNPVFIPFSSLCPGQTYFLRARENVCGIGGTPGPWTAVSSFVVPGPSSPLTATINASSTTICPPNCSNLTVSASGGCLGPGGTYNYDWAHIAGTNNPATINVCPITTTTYTCTITTPCGQTTTQNVTINVTTSPTAGIASVSTPTVCSGQTVNLSLVGAAGTIQWQSAPVSTGPWTNIPGATTSTYTTGPITSATCFQAVVTGCGTATSNIVCVTMSTAPPLTVAITNPLCFGGTGTATASTGFASYIWSSNTSITNIATGYIAGTYIVTGTTVGGCTATATFTLTNPVQLNITSISTTSVSCNGGNNGTANATVTGGTGSYTYSWTGGSTTNPVTNLIAGPVTLTVTDSNGCTATSNTIITQPTILSINTSQVPSNCGSASGSATATPLGGTAPYAYLWSNGQTTPTASGLLPGPYTVTVTDNNGCSQSSIVNVGNIPSSLTSTFTQTNVNCFGNCNGSIISTPSAGTAPYTYLWSNGQTAQNATGLCAGSYSVTITDAAGCTYTSSVMNITQPSTLALTPTASPSTICYNGISTLNANASGGTGPYTYAWPPTSQTIASFMVQLTSTTTYNVWVYDANGCAASAFLTVNVLPPLQTNLSPTFSNICQGDTVTLSASASYGDGGPYSFTWYPGGMTGSSIYVSPSTTTTFTTITSDGCSPNDTNYVIVNVNPLPVVSYTTTNLNGCEPLVVAYNNTTPGATNCIWTINGIPYNNCSVTHTFLVQGTYNSTLTVTDANGCVNTSSNVIANVWPNPTAAFNISPQIINIMEPTVTFNNVSSAGSYQWDFGDNQSSTAIAPTHSYSDIGTYTVQLIVTTQHGCKDTIYTTVYISDVFSIYIPNAFSPNGDGKNETFTPIVMGYDYYEFWIFDRWGEMLYHSNNGLPWDATYKGNIVQDGVYIWKVHAKEKDSPKHHQLIGHVSVIK